MVEQINAPSEVEIRAQKILVLLDGLTVEDAMQAIYRAHFRIKRFSEKTTFRCSSKPPVDDQEVAHG
ncbi:hypothetical protein [Comamonas odontotermitis]|uniref:hypothetical protein n=1 Tax=Comamonas TaxID=283 RepID=UPI003751E2D5